MNADRNDLTCPTCGGPRPVSPPDPCSDEFHHGSVKRPADLEAGDRIKLSGFYAGIVATVTAKPERDGQWGYKVVTDQGEFWGDYADDYDRADAALAALGLDDLDAAVERVAAVISYGYPHLHAEDNEGVRRTARDAIAALTTTGDRDG